MKSAREAQEANGNGNGEANGNGKELKEICALNAD